jgi:hypothetical protein
MGANKMVLPGSNQHGSNQHKDLKIMNADCYAHRKDSHRFLFHKVGLSSRLNIAVQLEAGIRDMQG